MTKLLKCNSIIFLSLFLFISSYAEVKNVQILSGFGSPNEVSIAINPKNPSIISAGSNLNLFYNSTDGGKTWSYKTMNSSLGVWGDPCLIYDADGNLYYAHLSNPGNPGYWIDRIVVQKSTNNGQSFNDGASVGFSPPRKNQDKEWLGADITNSPYRNNIYMAWTEFDKYGSSDSKDSSRILFSTSTDGGATWRTPIKVNSISGDCIDSDNTVEGCVPAVGPNGEVYISWAGPLGIMFDKSSDGGKTFGKDIKVSFLSSGWDYDIPGINRHNGMPVTASDISNSPYRGNVYINWADMKKNIAIFIFLLHQMAVLLGLHLK